MKILSNFYIFIVVLSKGIETEQEQQQRRQYLSLEKFNPSSSSSSKSCLRQTEKEVANTEVRLSPVTPVVHCSRQRRTNQNANKLTDKKQVRHYGIRAKVSATMRTMKNRSKETKKFKRIKREAKLPERFLLRYPPETLRDRRYSKRKIRRTTKIRKRKKRKRKRNDIFTMNRRINDHQNNTNGEVIVSGEEEKIIDKGHQTEKSNQNTRQVVFTILASLMALTASILLLCYLYKKSRKEKSFTSFDPFFCPPGIGKCREEEIDRCTCCSSNTGDKLCGRSSRCSSQTNRSRRCVSPSPPKQQQQQRNIKRMRPTRKISKKSVNARKKPTQKECNLIESESNRINKRLAHILETGNTDCQCCDGNEVEQPKRSRFKFFGKKKKKNKFCNDVRFNGNKINSQTNLYDLEMSNDYRVTNTNMFRDNPCGNTTSKAKRKSGLRIKE